MQKLEGPYTYYEKPRRGIPMTHCQTCKIPLKMMANNFICCEICKFGKYLHGQWAKFFNNPKIYYCEEAGSIIIQARGEVVSKHGDRLIEGKTFEKISERDIQLMLIRKEIPEKEALIAIAHMDHSQKK